MKVRQRVAPGRWRHFSSSFFSVFSFFILFLSLSLSCFSALGSLSSSRGNLHVGGARKVI